MIEAEPKHEMSYISNIPQKMNSVYCSSSSSTSSRKYAATLVCPHYQFYKY